MQAHSVATIIKSVGLDERAWIVLATRVGFSEKLTLQELATELGLTRERVRQIQSKSSAKLKFRIRTIAPILDALEPYAKQLWNPFEVGDIREAFTAVENALKKEG